MKKPRDFHKLWWGFYFIYLFLFYVLFFSKRKVYVSRVIKAKHQSKPFTLYFFFSRLGFELLAIIIHLARFLTQNGEGI